MRRNKQLIMNETNKFDQILINVDLDIKIDWQVGR